MWCVCCHRSRYSTTAISAACAASLMGTAITIFLAQSGRSNELNYGLRATLASIPMLLMFTATPGALADGTVNIALEDASEGGNLSGMKMTATPDSVKACRVTIHATNKSKTLVHESIVVLPPANGAPLPYDDKEGRVIEKRIKDLGEVSDLPPGKSGSLTVRLAPGNYLLICNQPNHYKAGMWTKLTVTQ
jgi:uncharacterized cupredoxin-like copper-binding protein